MKPIAAPLAALLLCGCIHLPSFHLPASAAAAPAAAPSAPVCPGSLLADIQPEPKLPDGAGFPAPTDEASSAAVALYGTWLHAWAVWARQGWSRAADSKVFCSTTH